MANNRIFWAVKQVGVAPVGEGTFTEIHGLQSVGITTTFNLEQVFEIGQLEIYENIEGTPDIEVTMEKVIDGYPLIYHLCTQGSTSNSLSGRQNGESIICMAVFGDTNDSATGVPETKVAMSGLFVSSLGYNIPVEGNCTESVTVVGNNKEWFGGADNSIYTFNGAFTTNADTPQSATGVQRRENVVFDYTATSLDANGQVVDSGATVLPTEIDGISSSGTNNRDSSGEFVSKVQSISVSTDLGREELFQLGRRNPYFRFVTFPVEVRCDIEVTATSGDLISATEAGVLGNGNNLSNQTIRVYLEDSTGLNLGPSNKLSSVTSGGADAGGGNEVIQYSYSNFNSLAVAHDADPG